MSRLRSDINVVVFDFDQTLADTSSLKLLRDSRRWLACNELAPQIAFYTGVLSLLETLPGYDCTVYLASSAPFKYLSPFVERLPRVFNKVLGFRTPRGQYGLTRRATVKLEQLREIQALEGSKAQLLHVGDDSDDASAAQQVGAQFAHACWGASCAGIPGIHPGSPQALLQLISELKGKNGGYNS